MARMSDQQQRQSELDFSIRKQRMRRTLYLSGFITVTSSKFCTELLNEETWVSGVTGVSQRGHRGHSGQ